MAAAAITSGLLILAVVLSHAGHGNSSPTAQVDALIAHRDFPRALQAAESRLARPGPRGPAWMQVALRKAQILQSLNRSQQGIDWLAGIQLESAQPTRGAALLLREQAWMEGNLGLYAVADAHLVRSLSIAEALGDRELAANIQVRRSLNLTKLGRIADADQALDDAEGYLRNHQDSSLYPFLFTTRGLVRMQTNRFEEALPDFERSVTLATQAGHRALIFSSLINIAWCQYRLGHLDRAMALYNQALPLAAPGDRHLCLGHLGNIFRDNREYAKAADYYRQAVDLARGRNREYYSIWLSNLAGTLCDEGRWEEAQSVNRQSFEVKKTIQASRGAPFETLNAARIAEGQGRPQEAEEIYRQLLSSSQSDPSPRLEASGRLAQLYATTGRPDLARRQFEAALALVDAGRADLREDENKLSYLAHLIQLHQQYVEFLAGRGDWPAAFAAAEASRARLLRERLGVAPASASHRPIADYQAAARAARATFLSYWIAPAKSYLWVITGAAFRTIELPGGPEIAALVDRYQNGLEKDRPLDRASGARLFDILLGQALSGSTPSGQIAPTPQGRFVIVPDGPLYGLNLETLPSGGPSAPESRYWLEDATVMVTPSLDLLLARPKQARPNHRLLLVGDADEWDDEFPKLPYASREIDAIEKSFPPQARQVLSGPAASPAGYQRAQPERFGLIHFAAHATASLDAPLDSAIVLSRQDGRGKLSVRDVLGMRTQAELVTLSACHSAGARTYAGEGLVGLAWAFLESGADSVIAGLWNVSDYSSPRLMDQLYAALAAGKSPAEALRAAKLDLLRGSKYAHPFYWGALQLYAGARVP